MPEFCPDYQKTVAIAFWCAVVGPDGDHTLEIIPCTANQFLVFNE